MANPADERLALLVRQAQAGDPSAREALYARFEWFLKKYEGFFKSEADAVRLARQYPDVAAFLGLFMSKKTYHAVQSRRWSPSLSAQIVRKVNEVIEMAKEIGDEGDMKAIIDITFFELVNRYDSKGKVRKELKKQGIDYDKLSKSQQKRYEAQIPPVGFEGYLMNVFKWRLFKNIEAETKGIVPGVGWCKAYSTNGGDPEGEEVNLAEQLSEETETFFEFVEGAKLIDHDWVQGDTCTPPFDMLTVQERWILKARYVDHLSSREIGEQIGVSSSVIRSRYNEILNKLLPKVDCVVAYDVKDWANKKEDEPEPPIVSYSHIRLKE